jgi:hypothetical protein
VDALEARGAGIESWFFKPNVDGLAFLAWTCRTVYGNGSQVDRSVHTVSGDYGEPAPFEIYALVVVRSTEDGTTQVVSRKE